MPDRQSESPAPGLPIPAYPSLREVDTKSSQRLAPSSAKPTHESDPKVGSNSSGEIPSPTPFEPGPWGRNLLATGTGLLLALWVGVMSFAHNLTLSTVSTLPPPPTALLFSILIQQGGMILAGSLLLLVLRPNGWALGWGRFSPKTFAKYFLMMLAWVIGLSLAVLVLWKWQTGSEPAPQTSIAWLQDGETPWRVQLVIAVAAVLGAPLAEELFFRALLFRGLIPLVGFPCATGIGALAFGLAHGEFASLPSLVAVGAILSIAYWRTRTIWAPMALHACFNLASILWTLAASGGE
ncbi:MAG: lysostaphin resistance A-like protein [Kiritimatiellia bacterium]